MMRARLRLSAACSAAVAILAGSLWSAKECAEFVYALPDVDLDGNLSFATPTFVPTQRCVNTKSGKYRVKVEGEVENESGVKQKYDEAGFFGMDEPGITRAKYRVKENGDAKLNIAGRDVPEM